MPSTCWATMAVLLAVCLATALPASASAATPAGRKILQTTAPRGGACGAAVNARCPSGQCCSQWGFCGVTTSHCGTGCQALYSAPGSTCAGATGPTQPPPPPPVMPPTPPPATPPTPPPATPPAACVDSYAACPGWGPASCIYGGVPQLCPCMCGSSSGGPTPPPPTPPPQPPVAPPPQPPVVPPPQPPGAGVAALISAQQWEQLFPNRNNPGCQGSSSNFYNYNAFLTAAASFPTFASSSPDSAVNLRELVAFLAQSSLETTGGWPTAPGGPYAWGLCFTTEGGLSNPPANNYCTPSAEWPCTPGKSYLGRGPMQLTHNYNYGPAGRALGFDGLNNPEIVVSDPVLAWRAALWFWMTPQAPKPSCHDVMAGRYTPTAADTAANRLPGYGLLTNIINGGLECGQGVIADKQQNRIGYYQRHASLMGVTTGANLDCANQRPFGQ